MLDQIVNAATAGAVDSTWIVPGAYGGVSPNRLENSQAEQRRKSIEDNFGVQTESLSDFRKKRGGSGILRGLLLGAATAGAIIGLGALAGLASPIFSLALFGGLIIGTIVGAVSFSRHNKHVRADYSNYLDQVAADGRAQQRGIQQSQSLEYDNGTPEKSFVRDLEASRANQQQMSGASR